MKPWSRELFLNSQLYHSRERLRIYSDAPRKGDHMGCLGVHFALSDDEVKKLKDIPDDADRLEFLQEEIEETYFSKQQGFMCETDKAWDAIHRTLTDGQIDYDNGEFPLSYVILGGERVYFGDDYIMVLKSPSEVSQISSALTGIVEADFRSKYFQIDEQDAGFPIDDSDFNYTWHWFEKLRTFYRRAAEQSRWVLFTASQ